MDLSSFTYTEPVTIKGAFDQWSGAFRGGHRQWTANWAEIGITGGGFSLGYLYRRDYDIRFSTDTASVYYRSENKLPMDGQRDYDLELRAHSFEAKGLRLRRCGQDVFGGGSKGCLGLSFFTTRALLDGELRGTARASDDGTGVAYTAEVDYFYTEDHLFDRRVNAPMGQGYAVDVSLSGTVAKLRYTLDVRDLLARLHWDEAPFTTAVARSSQDTYDEQGRWRIAPAVSGVEGYRDHVQRLSPRVHVRTFVPLVSKTEVALGYRRIFDFEFSELGLTRKFGTTTLSAFYWSRLEAFGFEIEGPVGVFRLMGDGYSSENHTLALDFTVRVAF